MSQTMARMIAATQRRCSATEVTARATRATTQITIRTTASRIIACFIFPLIAPVCPITCREMRGSRALITCQGAPLLAHLWQMLAAVTFSSIILWAICLLLAVGVAWTRYDKKKTRDKFLRELVAMDPVRREKVLSRLRPEIAMELRQQLMERYRISSIQSARS